MFHLTVQAPTTRVDTSSASDSTTDVPLYRSNNPTEDKEDVRHVRHMKVCLCATQDSSKIYKGGHCTGHCC